MLVHGFVPESFCNNVIIPIVKNRYANCNDPTNYRPISIEPICTKLFELCLVPVLEPFLCFHSNQFGFVTGGGCNKALFAFRTTVEYFQIIIVVFVLLHLICQRPLIVLTIMVY